MQRSQIFKQNLIILIQFYCIFSDLSHTSSCGCVWVGVCVGVSRCAPTCPNIHAHTHMHMDMCNTKIYMYSNCKWLPPWRHPCLSCLTCMCICACIHACMHMCTCMGHPHIPTPPTSHINTPLPLPRDVTPQIS